MDKQTIISYAKAFILYELDKHYYDPRESLDGTSLRLRTKDGQGYKYELFSSGHDMIGLGAPYIKKITNMLAFPDNDLVEPDQKKLINGLDEAGIQQLEEALRQVYETEDDEASFEKLASVSGRNIGFNSFVFFLKDSSRYLPVYPSANETAETVTGSEHGSEQGSTPGPACGSTPGPAPECSWTGYTEYIERVKSVRDLLKKYLNDDLTLLDAQSFILMLPELDEYLDSDLQIVEHTVFGKGVVEKEDDDAVTVRFANETTRLVKNIVFRNRILRDLPIEIEADDVFNDSTQPGHPDPDAETSQPESDREHGIQPVQPEPTAETAAPKSSAEHDTLPGQPEQADDSSPTGADTAGKSSLLKDDANHRFQPGDIVQHFKRELLDEKEREGNRYLYQIVGIASHSETMEPMMVYQALYDDQGMFVRPLEMFLSEVDHEKYPQVLQKYRFETIEPVTAFS